MKALSVFQLPLKDRSQLSSLWLLIPAQSTPVVIRHPHRAGPDLEPVKDRNRGHDFFSSLMVILCLYIDSLEQSVCAVHGEKMRSLYKQKPLQLITVPPWGLAATSNTLEEVEDSIWTENTSRSLMRSQKTCSIWTSSSECLRMGTNVGYMKVFLLPSVFTKMSRTSVSDSIDQVTVIKLRWLFVSFVVAIYSR